MAGIADAGQAGVGDDGDAFAGGEFFDQLRGAPRFVVFVIADERLVDLEVPEQIPGVPRVFAGDEIDALEHLQRAQRDVPEIADGSGDEEQQVES